MDTRLAAGTDNIRQPHASVTPRRMQRRRQIPSNYVRVRSIGREAITVDSVDRCAISKIRGCAEMPISSTTWAAAGLALPAIVNGELA